MTEEIQYDVFLSHNSQDKPAVEELARCLTDLLNQIEAEETEIHRTEGN